MGDKDCDLVILGGGPGGYSAAIRARQLGLSVVLVEKEKLGGVCLNWGCIPTKALLNSAETWEILQGIDSRGIVVDKATFDWNKMIANSREVSEKLSSGIVYLMKKNEVEVYKGVGRISPLGHVEVSDSKGEKISVIRSQNIIISTGSRPRSLPDIDIDGELVLSSRHAMELTECPNSLAIIGAGAIGIEFAYFFNSFGCNVTLLESANQLLPREDPEVADLLADLLGKKGIDIITGVKVSGLEIIGDKGCLSFGRGGKEKTLSVDKVLMAVGVEGLSEGIGLEALGVRKNNDLIEVNERQQTSVNGIWAIGDVAGAPQLAHAAVAEGIAAVEFISGRKRPPVNRQNIPNCIYSQPQVASTGLSEALALSRGIKVKIGRFPFQASGKALASGHTDGFVKLIFGSEYGELLGGTIIGFGATELIAEVSLAINMEATYEELLWTIHAHPTLSEVVMEAAGAAFDEAINI